MSSKIQAVTYKSPHVKAIVNTLLGPFLRSNTSGIETGGLLFKHQLEMDDATIADAPKGYFTSKYTHAMKPEKVDPTAHLVKARRTHRDEVGALSDKGPSSVLAEHDASMHITGAFVEWFFDYCERYQSAGIAQAAIRGKATKTLGYGKTRTLQDRIAPFLIMSGELTGSEYGMTENEDIDVNKIFEQALDMLRPTMEALDHHSFGLCLTKVQSSRGHTTMPDGTAVEFVSPDVFEMMTHPWNRVFKVRHARRMLREAFISRIAPEACAQPLDYIIGEGNQNFFIPADIMLNATSPAQVYDLICERVDGMQPLSTADYQRNFAEFTDVFRTNGDLVRGIFIDRTIDVTKPSNLNVLLASISLEVFDGGEILTVGHEPFGTGGLGTKNLILDDRTNVITGMTPLYADYTDMVAGANKACGQTFALPNQVLDISAAREMTVLDWVDFLTWYRSTFSSNMKKLLRETGRTRRDLKHLSVSIKSPLEYFASLSYNSQKNGVLTKAFASFNIGKWDRAAQQGPTLLDVCTAIGPAVLAGENGWTRPETANISRVSVSGSSLTPPPGGYCSSFVGEPQGKKSPTPLMPNKVPSTLALGVNNIEMGLAGNMLSMPLDISGEDTLRMVKRSNQLYHLGTRGVMTNGRSDQSQTILLAEPHMHPTEGFKRGYIFLARSGANSTGATTTVAANLGYCRVTSTGTANCFTIASGTPLRNGLSTTHDIIAPRLFGSFVTDDPNTLVTTLNQNHWLDTYGGASTYQELLYGQLNAPDNLPVSIYYHDPTNTVAIGGTNHIIYGEYYSEVCLYAAQSALVEVTSGAIHTRDMQDRVPTNYSLMNASFLPVNSLGVADTKLKNVGCVPQVDVAFFDGRVEQDTHSLPALTVNNGWIDRKDVISESLALQHMAEFDYNAADWLVTAATARGANLYGTSSVRKPTEVAHMSPFRRAFSTTNGNGRGPYSNPATGFGLNATSGLLLAATVFPAYGGAIGRNSFFDGPATTPMNDDHNVMLIQGYGRCSKGYTNNVPLDVLPWIERTILDAGYEAQTGPYSLSEYSELMESPHYGFRSGQQDIIQPLMPVLAPIDDDLSPIFKAQHNLSDNGHTTERWFITDVSGVSRITPQWFKDLRGEVDEMSGVVEYAGTLGSPWMRASNDTRGYEVQPMHAAKVSTLIKDVIQTQFAKDGNSLEGGYSDALFIAMNTQGV